MIYTVGEMAQKLGVPASTLRYYDKEGLLPFVERSSGGIRMFRENDFEWLQVIRCMKKAGMSIKDIRQYIELSMQGGELAADLGDAPKTEASSPALNAIRSSDAGCFIARTSASSAEARRPRRSSTRPKMRST